MTDAASKTKASADSRSRMLKEQVYAAFTGLAVVVVFRTNLEHTTIQQAFITLAVAVVGISAAGFVADVIAHQVSHGRNPSLVELRHMGLVSLGALGSAAIPLFAFVSAWLGWITLGIAVTTALGVYVALLLVVVFVAVSRVALSLGQRLYSLALMLGFCVVVVVVLLLSHLH